MQISSELVYKQTEFSRSTAYL